MNPDLQRFLLSFRFRSGIIGPPPFCDAGGLRIWRDNVKTFRTVAASVLPPYNAPDPESDPSPCRARGASPAMNILAFVEGDRLLKLILLLLCLAAML